MAYPKRKRLRLQEYDYSANGAYFITICTKNRLPLLCHIVGGDAFIAPRAELTDYGRIVRKYLLGIRGLDQYCIMPNHVHMIVQIDGPSHESTTTQSVSQLVKSFKILVTKEIGHPIFQRSFYDHVIRNQRDYLRIWNYIDQNPYCWEKDCYFIECHDIEKG